MRVYNLDGPEFKVSVLKSTVYNFGISRSYTGLSYKRGISFVFDKRTGGVISHNANANAEPAAVVGLEIMARAYGAQKLGLSFVMPADVTRQDKRRARRTAKKAREIARHHARKAAFKARNHRRAVEKAANAAKATTDPLPATRAERRQAKVA